MPRDKFNPLDPLGLFKKRDEEAYYQDLVPERRAGWRPPDPLGLLDKAPDPFGLFHRKKNSGYSGSGATIGNPIPIEFNGNLVNVKNQAREVLIAKGYPPKQVDMALHWAEEWLMGMARRMAPGNIQLQRSVVQSAYAEIASRAEKWLQGIEAAFSVSPRMLAA